MANQQRRPVSDTLGGPDPGGHEDELGEDRPGAEDELGADRAGTEDVLGGDQPVRRTS